MFVLVMLLNVLGFGLSAMFGYDSSILSTRAVYGAFFFRRREIHMIQAKAHTEAITPLKVIQQ